MNRNPADETADGRGLEAQAWARAVELYPVGSVVVGVVGPVFPFGLFVELEEVGLAGFIAYPNLDPLGRPVAPGSPEVPDMGDELTAVVLDQQDWRRQLWLSCKRTDFPQDQPAIGDDEPPI